MSLDKGDSTVNHAVRRHFQLHLHATVIAAEDTPTETDILRLEGGQPIEFEMQELA